MLDKRKNSGVLILLGLTMLAGLLGCSDSSDAPQETDSSPNAADESDRIVGKTVDLWELSTNGSYWLFKEEYANGGARCEALGPQCGWEWNEETQKWEDVWVFDYGSMEFIENPDL